MKTTIAILGVLSMFLAAACSSAPAATEPRGSVATYSDELSYNGGQASYVEHACPSGSHATAGECACNGCAIDDSLPSNGGRWFCIATPDPRAVEAWVHMALTCEPDGKP